MFRACHLSKSMVWSVEEFCPIRAFVPEDQPKALAGPRAGFVEASVRLPPEREGVSAHRRVSIYPSTFRPRIELERSNAMAGIELSAGIVEYQDTGGSAPVVVLLHGLVVDGSVWRHVVDGLRDDHRCVVPMLPRGAHRQAMRPNADVSLRGVARLEEDQRQDVVLELRGVYRTPDHARRLSQPAFEGRNV